MNENETELEKGFSLYYDNFDLYMKKYVIPEVYARQLASIYYRNLKTNETLNQHVGSIESVFNVTFSFEDIRQEVEEILKIKYNVIITNEKPLVLSKYE